MSDLQDEAWVDTLRKAKDEQPLVHTALDAIEPLAELGLKVDDVRRHLQSKRGWAEQVLVREGIVGEFQVEYVLVIYSYTVENPYKEWGGPIYKLVNAEMHSPTRGEGGAADGLSPRLRAAMPYIKLLWVALEALPAKYHWKESAQRCRTCNGGAAELCKWQPDPKQ